MPVEMIPSLTLAAADDIARRAQAAAMAAGVAVCVAVVDRAGHLLVFQRQSGAPFHSIQLAQDKAYTAVSFGRPTAQWDTRLAQASEMLRHGLLHAERFVPFGGGIPIEHNGLRIGAIGISGGSEAQDVAFAEAALAAWAAA